MRLIITESQYDKFIKEIVNELNSHFADREIICKFIKEEGEQYYDQINMVIVFDKVWVKNNLKGDAIPVIKSILAEAKDYILDKYNAYVTFRPTQAKC